MSEEDTIDIAPKPSTIGSYQAKQQPWWLMISELVDNSFDAKAGTVWIRASKDQILIEDDGLGCSDVADMITFGAHDSKGRITSGMWGVGGTSAMIWIGKETRIETVCNGLKQSLRIDWDAIKKLQSWKLPRPLSFPSDERTGTKVAMIRLRSSRAEWKEIAIKLGQVFKYAIEDNRRIIISLPSGQTTNVASTKDPLFSKVVNETIDLSSGRKLLLNAGIVARGQINERPGLTYVYTHRVILDSSAIGLGDGAGMSAISGSVRLIPEHKWKNCIPTNKDGLGPLEQEIDAAITSAMGGLLMEAKGQAEELHTRFLEQEISEGMTEALLSNVKEKRKPKDNTGSHPKAATGITRNRIRKEQPGERALKKLQENGIRLEFSHIGSSGGRRGIADTSKRIVTLSLDNKYIEKIHHRKDRLLIAREAFDVYLDALAYKEDEESRAQQNLFGIDQSDSKQRFMEMLSKVLGEIDFDKISGRRLSVVNE